MTELINQVNGRWQGLMEALRPRLKRFSARNPGTARALASFWVLAGRASLLLIPIAALYVDIRMAGVLLDAPAYLSLVHWFGLATAAVLSFLSYELITLRFDTGSGVVVKPTEATALRKLIDRRVHSFETAAVDYIQLTYGWEMKTARIPRNGLLLGRQVQLKVGAPVLMTLSRDQFRVLARETIGQLAGEKDRDAHALYESLQEWERLQGALDQTHLARRVLQAAIGHYIAVLRILSQDAEYTHHLNRERYGLDVVNDEAVLSLLSAESVGQCFLEERYQPTLLKMAERNPEPTARPFSNFGPLLRQLLTTADADLWLLREMSGDRCTSDHQPSLRQRVNQLGYHELKFYGLPKQPAAYEYLGDSLGSLFSRLDKAWAEEHRADWEAVHEEFQLGQHRFQQLDDAAQQKPLEGDAALRYVELAPQYLPEDEIVDRFEHIMNHWQCSGAVLYRVGEALLEQQHPGGLRALQEAMKRDKRYLNSAASLIEEFRVRRKASPRKWIARASVDTESAA